MHTDWEDLIDFFYPVELGISECLARLDQTENMTPSRVCFVSIIYLSVVPATLYKL